MKGMPAHDRFLAIIGHRAVTERCLAELLTQAGSSTTLNEIKALIFDETPATVPVSRYFQAMLEFFEHSDTEVDIDVLLRVLQDAWNYFPHRRLDGRCPAELLDLHAGT